MTCQSVQVKLELGHRATFREKPTPQGFTHDWCVFVRGPSNESSIHHFVDKVVFTLHDSFHKPRRVIKDYPFQVAEAGYAGFLMPIEVYFKNKEEPKKVIFQYDLFLHVHGQPPVNHIRCEKLTFNNPTEDFRRKLIKAGGVGILEGESSPSHTADKPAALSTYKPHSASTSMQYKIKQEPDDKYSSTSGKPPKPTADVKPAWKEHKAASKGPKSASKEPKATTKEPKSTTGKPKETKAASKDINKSTKESKSNSKVAQKGSGKRPPSSSPPPPSSGSSSSDGPKKRKKSTAAKEKNSAKNAKNDKSDKGSSEKTKGKGKSSKSKSTAKQNSKKVKDTGKDNLFAPEIVVDRKKSKEKKEPPPPKVLSKFEDELSTEEKGADDDDDMDVPSPSSSISFSSLPRGGGKGALNTLMHEIDENDDDFDDQDIVTPFQTDYSNHHHSTVSNNISKPYDSDSSRASSPEREREKEKDKGRGKGKSKEKEKATGGRKGGSSNGPKKNAKSERKSRNSESSSGGGSKSKSQSQSNHDYLTELVHLHRKLMALKSREQIQRIVDLVGDTEHFQITDSSFDFDLCSLDKTTVRKLQESMSP